MIEPASFFRFLEKHRIGPFVGVPCSLISSLIAYAVDHKKSEYVNPAHESHAMAFAAGAFLTTGKLPMVFLQNSGFGNIVNPLTSLHQMYDIPALLLVTWRAEDGYGTDAPEHWIVGRDMEQYFKTFHLPYRILTEESWEKDVEEMAAEALSTKKPAVLCVKKGLFAPHKAALANESSVSLTSKEAIGILKEMLPDGAFLSTTGMISRDSFTVKDTPDFYMMGSMGLIAGIAAGVAANTDKQVVALDGDGAILMHLGLLSLIGARRDKNLLHVVLDNGAYSSTGGQPTLSGSTDLSAVARACGYARVETVKSVAELRAALKDVSPSSGPVFLHVKVRSGNDHGIGRVSDAHSCPDVTDRFSGNFRKLA